MGCFFVSISAFLYAAKHLTAAIMTANMNNTQANYFDGGYQAMNTGIGFWIVSTLLLGMVLLFIGVWPVFAAMATRKK